MRTLSKFIIGLAICFLNYSCGQTSSKTIELNGKTYTLKEDVNVTNLQLTKKAESKIIFHKIDDTQRNMVMGYLPMPSDWKYLDKQDKDGVYIKGTNNVRVFMPKFDFFVYSRLPGYNQMSSEMGQKVKPLKCVELLVKDEFVPLFGKEGARLLKQYHLPKLKAYDENYDQFMFKSVPQQKSFEAYATEWEGKDGNRFLLIIRQNITYNQEACYWGYTLNSLESPKQFFETAKNNYLYTLENTKYNPQWRHACYMEDAQKSAQAGKLHQQRMANLRTEGQRIIERGKAHSAMVDRNHKNFIDAHLERQTVSASGTNYQVDAGSNVYWVNANGEYIPTNNVNFDPNLDPNLNNQTWTKGNINN